MSKDIPVVTGDVFPDHMCGMPIGGDIWFTIAQGDQIVEPRELSSPIRCTKPIDHEDDHHCSFVKQIGWSRDVITPEMITGAEGG